MKTPKPPSVAAKTLAVIGGGIAALVLLVLILIVQVGIPLAVLAAVLYALLRLAGYDLTTS